MANLPSNRTKLQSAISNQIAGTTADASANINALIEGYDTLDLLNQKVDALVAAGVLSPIPPVSIFRQAIINGNFDIWQRGTSWTNPASGTYTADRWAKFQDGTGHTFTVSQQAFSAGQGVVPNEPKYFIRAQCTVAASGQTFNSLTQKIESCRSFAGNKVTVSLWAKADTNRNVNVTLRQYFGSGGSSDVYASGNGTISLNSTWQKFIVTFTLPSINGKTIGTNDCLILDISLPTNTTFTVDIAQVQVNFGDVAYPFQPKSFADELQACLRYYEKSYSYATSPGTASFNSGIEQKVVPSNTIASAQVYGKTTFKVKKRASPTVTIYPFTTPSNTGQVSNASGIDLGANTGSVTGIGDDGFTVYNNSGTATTLNNAVIYHWTADCEL